MERRHHLIFEARVILERVAIHHRDRILREILAVPEHLGE